MEILKPDNSSTPTQKEAKQLYRILWRWHFYAGIFTIPFIIILSITGALYLFKPQIDAIHDAPYRNLSITGDLTTPEQQVATALAAVPQAKLVAYELPRENTDAINILVTQSGEKIRVYVNPYSLDVLGTENEKSRFLNIVHDIHGELLLGSTGSVIVEIAACWAIVLVLTGIYLWWPRSVRGLAGVIYPRFSLKGRLFWRDLHAVIGMWISFFVLFLLVSGLPWALVWGSAFKEVRQLTGTAPVMQDWTIAGQHHHEEMSAAEHSEYQGQASLTMIIADAKQLHFTYPVLVSPPSQKSPSWSVKSNAQNRSLRAEAYLHPQTGEVLHQQAFSERHIIDRAIGIGVSAHEGQLFGWLNQLLGLLTAISLIVLSISGFIMWRKRAPEGELGAPPALPDVRLGKGFIAIIFTSAILLPVLGASLIVIALIERLILARWEPAKKWLGLV